MKKGFYTAKEKVIKECFDFTVQQLNDLINERKPKEIWHSQWSSKKPFIVITEYNNDGFMMYCNAMAEEDRKPAQYNPETLHRYLRYQGLEDCYIN